MILQALTQYYEDLLAQGKIARPGWAVAKVSWALELTAPCWDCSTCKGRYPGAKRPPWFPRSCWSRSQ